MLWTTIIPEKNEVKEMDEELSAFAPSHYQELVEVVQASDQEVS